MSEVGGICGTLDPTMNAQGSQERTRYVVFSYCISIIILTFKRESEVVAIEPGESAFVKGLPYTLLTLAFGWWGFPFGPIFSVMALFTNLTGGKDVTHLVQGYG